MNFIPNHSNLSFQKKFLKRCVTAGIIIELNISCSFHLFDAREGVYPDVPGHLSSGFPLLIIFFSMSCILSSPLILFSLYCSSPLSSLSPFLLPYPSSILCPLTVVKTVNLKPSAPATLCLLTSEL